MSDKEVRKEPQNIELPQTIIDSFARFLVPEIRKYYESEQGRREFGGKSGSIHTVNPVQFSQSNPA